MTEGAGAVRAPRGDPPSAEPVAGAIARQLAPRARIRAYWRGAGLYRKAAGLVDAVWCGAWLGTFGHDDLHALDATYYSGPTMYAGDEYNSSGLMEWEQEAVRAAFPAAGRVLVIAAGGGREVLALSGRGYVVDGYECNPALVDYAGHFLARVACAATVRWLPRDEAPAGGGPYDAAVVGWTAYALIPGRHRRVAFLRGVRRLLADGAPVIVSFFTRASDSQRLRAVRAIGSAVRRLRGDEPVELGDDLAPNYIHRFSQGEVAAEMAEGGFRLTSFAAQRPGRPAPGWAVGIAAAPREGHEGRPPRPPR